MGLLTVMKGLPLTYNRDLQEDKEGFFDTVDTLLATLRVFQGMLPGVALNEDRVAEVSGESYMLATDLADYLVGKGVPFREAHGVMRRLCRYCEDHGADLQTLSMDKFLEFSPAFGSDVYGITAASSVAARDNPGGTAPNRVAEGLRQARAILRDDSPDNLRDGQANDD
jgi:argininosuccinate lyase